MNRKPIKEQIREQIMDMYNNNGKRGNVFINKVYIKTKYENIEIQISLNKRGRLHSLIRDIDIEVSKKYYNHVFDMYDTDYIYFENVDFEEQGSDRIKDEDQLFKEEFIINPDICIDVIYNTLIDESFINAFNDVLEKSKEMDD